ncbi:MAG TPA: hypothetical protein VMT51_14085 [Dongiaceae bacterium]|nr:hypothetical protein [Dongiaceae bacterium]
MARFAQRLALPAALAAAALLLGACTAPLGPGYLVNSQEIQVTFVAEPQPSLSVSASYQLKNTGNRPLETLEVRLPRGAFQPLDLRIEWDGEVPLTALSEYNPRDTTLHFSQPWTMGASHRLQFTYRIGPVAPTGDSSSALAMAADAFYLPAEGWAPVLPQERGLFGFGGVPPAKWQFTVRAPADFLVHASGEQRKSRTPGQFVFEQKPSDSAPFVVAGRYHLTEFAAGQNGNLHLWTRGDASVSVLRPAANSLRQTIAGYDALLGKRGKSEPPLWIVECPAASGCVSPRLAGYSALLYGQDAQRTADMISPDTLLVLPQSSIENIENSAGPALATAWLGYGRNPGFYEQQPPMSALPAFAAALALENSAGPQARSGIVARALAQIPASAGAASNSEPAVVRAKSLLLFYALRDRAGAQAFQNALRHMLSARQARGFDVSDLISAIEQETHQPVGPFVRQWLKRPGVPGEFRAQYAPQLSRSNPQRSATQPMQEVVP